MSSSRQISTAALILKRTNSGEADRVVTLITPDQGKIVCIAKGVRKMTSSRGALLETGNLVKCQLVQTHGLPILTQATLISDCLPIHGNLVKHRQLVQFLEILDRLLVEQELELVLFEHILSIRSLIVTKEPTSGTVTGKLESLLEQLGYQHPDQTKFNSILEYVAALTEKPLKSWEYLVVKT